MNNGDFFFGQTSLNPDRVHREVLVCVDGMVTRAVSAVVVVTRPVLCVCFQEEFCFPVECLSLTVEEVMHIRQVLVKADLEKFQQYKDVYNAMKKGKVSLPLVIFTQLKSKSLGLNITVHIVGKNHLTRSFQNLCGHWI